MADDEGSHSSHMAEPMRAVIDASPVPMTITRQTDGRILFANPACLRMLGRTRSDVVGRTVVEVGFWPRREDRASMLAQLEGEDGVHDLEHAITTRGGGTIVALTSVSRVQFEGEACLVGHIHDVTEERRLQAQLRESEERFRQVTEALQRGFLLRQIDPPAVLYASPAMEQIYGLDRDTLHSDPHCVEKLMIAEDRERVVARRAEMTSATDFEFRIVRPDGRLRWIRSRVEPVVEDGQMTRLASVSEDITDKRELREALRDSEERFRLLAENSTDVIARSSPDWTIRYMSPASRALYGYAPQEMVGRSGWDFIHPEDRARLAEELSTNVSAPGDGTNVYRVRRKDGSHVWVEAKTQTLRDPDSNEIVQFHTYARDISARREAEDVGRRTQEDAEQANLAKSEFLSRMSHELRTPLHAILGFGELLAQEDLSPAQRDGLVQITRGGRHLLELIDEVLDISAIERGQLRLSLEPVHVGTVVREALDMIAPLAAARSIALPTPDEETLDCYVHADRQRLKQVLLNLLSNAVKYNRDAGVVRVSASGGETARTRIVVCDSGIGIAPEDHDRVFAAFERLGARATDVVGTGLGLTLTKRLIEAMAGRIGVESEIGTGTTFWIELPVVDAPHAPVAEASPAFADARARLPARTVLYIEDNPSNIRLAEAILASRPEVTLLVATQGGLGIELAREHRPSAVLLDLHLPDMPGEQVLRRFRADPRTAQIPVVVLSADATPGQIARLRRAGADGYLTKPFDIEQFLDVIDGAAIDVPATGASAGTAAGASAEAGGPLRLERLATLRRLYPASSDLRGFVELFVADMLARLEGMQGAARGGDAPAVWQAAHAMRGACSLAGAHRVETLLAQIETIAGRDEVPAARQITALRTAFGEAADALERELS
jgi:PAS domain S-box-containing protein